MPIFSCPVVLDLAPDSLKDGDSDLVLYQFFWQIGPFITLLCCVYSLAPQPEHILLDDFCGLGPLLVIVGFLGIFCFEFNLYHIVKVGPMGSFGKFHSKFRFCTNRILAGFGELLLAFASLIAVFLISVLDTPETVAIDLESARSGSTTQVGIQEVPVQEGAVVVIFEEPEELDTTNHPEPATEPVNEPSPESATEREVETAEGEVEDAEREVEATEGEVESAEGEVESAEGEVESAEGEVESAEGEVEDSISSISSLSSHEYSDVHDAPPGNAISAPKDVADIV